MFVVKEQPTFVAQPSISLPAGETDTENCTCRDRRRCTRHDPRRPSHSAFSFLQGFNRRQFIIPASCFLLLIFILYLYDLNTTGGKGVGAATNFLRRALVDTTSENGNQSVFVRHKLYLIVVFIGAFVLLWFFLVFSLWCCREAFENPCCCPCYLCAYCGGIACLECILCC